MYIMSSAMAEMIADVFLCPFEAIKLRMQISKIGTFPLEFGKAFMKIKSQEGFRGFYKGLAALWSRQVPYTIIKFVAFESIIEWAYKFLLTRGKDYYSDNTQLAVTTAAGFSAGVLCATASHPMDTMVSKIYAAEKTSGKGIVKLVKEIYK